MINFADVFIIILLAAIGFLGSKHGLIKQTCITIGALIALFAVALAYDKLAFLTEKSNVRTIILIILSLVLTILCYDIASHIGSAARKRLQPKLSAKSRTWDRAAGAGMAVFGTIIFIWLTSPISTSVGPIVVRQQVASSEIVLNAQRLGEIPPLIKNIALLLSPFSSPDAFTTQEPNFEAAIDATITGEYTNLDKAIAYATPSIVKITAWGCGSVGAGSGFIVGKNRVATNAHVIAGAGRLSLENGDKTIVAKPIWFDPKLDLAILLTEADLTGPILNIQEKTIAPGSIGGVLGYPNGEGFAAGDATILQKLSAGGYDIYGQTKTTRHIYAVRGSVVPGNSGGPLINVQGDVIGLIFGHSTVQNRTGYAIAADQISGPIKTASDRTQAVSTGSCTGD